MISCQKPPSCKMRIDVDQQFVVVVGERLPGRLREIIARIGRGRDFRQFAERLSRIVRSSTATSL